MRTRFDQQLENLHIELIQMGALCEDGISTATKALLEQDFNMAKRAKEAEREIDQKERDVETLCMKLLLQQQPVATDLRVISSALKMISDLERIGDQAADIAELTTYVQFAGDASRTHIGDMARATIRMVTDSIDSFVHSDLTLARDVIAQDDTVDALFLRVKQELLTLISQDSVQGELALDLLLVAKYYERIGDHATNVAEWVLYAITGTHPQGDE